MPRGGQRRGSGRKPRSATQERKCRKLIDDALPDIIAKIIELAKGGDKACCLALFYHRLGKPRAVRDETQPDTLEVVIGRGKEGEAGANHSKGVEQDAGSHA